MDSTSMPFWAGKLKPRRVVLLSAAEAQPRAEPRLRWRLLWSDFENAKDGIYAGATFIYRISPA
jgi:hypothetical protein